VVAVKHELLEICGGGEPLPALTDPTPTVTSFPSMAAADGSLFLSSGYGFLIPVVKTFLHH
jgi:hypothetical protein